MTNGKIIPLALFAAAMVAASLSARAQQPAPAPVPGPADQPPPPSPPRPKSRLSPLATAPDWRILEGYSGIMSREEFESVFVKIYSSAALVTAPWTISPDAVTVQTGAAGAPVRISFRPASADELPLKRFWRKAVELPRLRADEPPLAGLHIALDPGHIGGNYAVMEERWLSMAPGEAIAEGQLSLQVAKLLKPKLEALGARVSLVRSQEEPVTKAKPADFRDAAKEILLENGVLNPAESYAGVQGGAKSQTLQYQQEKLFYRVSEIRARAARVNDELKPDLVLCLHLNADAWGDPAKPSFAPGNHFHVLVNGCYSDEETHLDDVRVEMLGRLFARVHEEELALADPVAAAVARETALPPFTYPNHNARRVTASPYVWARNLLANRLYQCPVIYLEPFVMNNEKTYRRLLLGPFTGRTLLGEDLVTSPLEDYARGVAQGLEDYYSKVRIR